jgi:transcriptional regulator with XRE-family HTH domain
MNAPAPTTLSAVVGQRLRELRSHHGVPQDDLAAEARQFGLADWSKSTIAALESGRRQLTIGEMLLLPAILDRARIKAPEFHRYTGPGGEEEADVVGYHPVDHADLIPNDDRPIFLAGGAQLAARVVREVFAPEEHRHIRGWWWAFLQTPQLSVGDEAEKAVRQLPRSWFLGILESVKRRWAAAAPPKDWHDPVDTFGYRDAFWHDVGRDVASDTTQKAAAALGVPPLAVALAAQALWGWSLRAEREHRLGGSGLLAIGARLTDEATAKLTRDWGLSEEQARAWRDSQVRGKPESTLPPLLRRKVQAVRGHFTRELLGELRPLVKDVAKKKPMKRSTKRRAR